MTFIQDETKEANIRRHIRHTPERGDGSGGWVVSVRYLLDAVDDARSENHLLRAARAEDTHAWAKLVAYAQEHWPLEIGRNVAEVFIERSHRMRAALLSLLTKETNRWKEQGYGRATLHILRRAARNRIRRS